MNDIDNDNQFIEELQLFNQTLNKPTPQMIERYNAQMRFMESIHDEIRLKNPQFMPVYVHQVAEEKMPKNRDKYLDMVYSLGTI